MLKETQNNGKSPSSKEENLVNRKATLAKGPVRPALADYAPETYLPTAPYNPNSERSVSSKDMWDAPLNDTEKSDRIASIRTKDIYQGERYDNTFVGSDYEEMHGQQQSASEKWFNASAKMVGTIGTTAVSGTAGLIYGIGDAIANQRLASIVDNDVTRKMDDVSKGFEDSMANYYTKQETEADWWSPDNILTANFWSDKVLKNLGFSVGSMLGGVGWSALFKGIGLTNKLVRAGKGMDAAKKVERAIADAPKGAKYTAWDKALRSVDNKLTQGTGSVLRNSDRILLSTMGSAGEATIEGLGAMTEMENRMLEEFKLENGRMPSTEERNEMKAAAERAGLYVWGLNNLILTGTNYIQLGKIVGSSRKADKALINKIGKNKKGVWEPKKQFGGKVGAGVKQAGRILFAPVEGLEEGLQFASSTGVDDYFSKAYENRDETVGFLSTMSEVMGHVYTKGLDETLNTKEGLESILIGALSGGMQQSGVFGSYQGKDGKKKYGFAKSGTIAEYGFTGTGGERGANTAAAITELNKLDAEKALKDGMDYMGIGIGSQEARQAAIANDDKLAEKNAETDYALSYVMPRAKYGKIDSVNEELTNYKTVASNPEGGFAELQSEGIANPNETSDKFIERIDNLLEMAQKIDKNYEALNDRYENLVDENGEPVYSSDVIDKMVYTAAKVQDFDNRITSLENDLLSSGADLGSLAEKINNNENLTEADIAAVVATADNVDMVDQETIEESVIDYAELLLLRQKYAKEYTDIRDAPLDYKTVEPTTQTPPVPTEAPEGVKESVVITTPDGVKTFKKGFYYAGNVPAEAVKAGATLSAPTVEIIGQNENGTIKAKFPNGEERDLTVAQFEGMELGTLDSTKDNKKAAFYVDNWNTPFNMDLGDDGVKTGRIIYNEETDKLQFVYVDSSGKNRMIEVTNDQFDNRGDDFAQIQRVEPANKAQLAIQNEFLNAKDERKDKKHEDALTVLGELLDETTKKHEKTKKVLKTRKANLARTKKKVKELNKELATKVDKRVKNATVYTKVGKEILGNIRRMEKDIEALEKEIVAHKEDVADIGVTLAYVQDLIDNIDTADTDLGDFIRGIKKSERHLSELKKQTKDNITGIEKYIEELREFVSASKNVLIDLLNQLGTVFPEVSTEGMDISDTTAVEDYLADLADLTGSQTEGDKLAFAGVTMDQVKPKKTLINKMNKALEGLEKEFKSLESDVSAREAVLEKFGELQELRKKIQAEEQALANNPVIAEDIINSLQTGPSPPTPLEYSEDYEVTPKKSDTEVVTSTIAPTGTDGNPVGEYAERAQIFGNKYHDLIEEGKKFRGTVVTQKTENEIIPGLVAHLIGESGADPRTVIAMVVTDSKGVPIDKEGNPIQDTEAQLKEGIYQVFPLEKLALAGQTMFRANTPIAERERLTQAYAVWRSNTLKADNADSHEMGASFGLFDYIEILDEDGSVMPQASEAARSNAAEAGLVDNDSLEDKGVVMVATQSGGVTYGSSVFSAQEGKSILGHVFLKVPGGLAKLYNKQKDKKQAELLFDVFNQLAKNVARDGNGKGVATQDLFTWLRTVVFWGSPTDKDGNPKNPTDGSMWYEYVNGVPKLRIGKSSMFDLTPASLELHKDTIVSLIQQTYGQTNATSVADGAHLSKYKEIVAIKKDGTPQYVTWPNYQSYLLANKSPDANGELTVPRDNDNIPLKTKIKPLEGPEDTNKKGIYFTLHSDAIRDGYTPVPQAPVKKVIPTKKGTTKVVKSEGPIWNGTIENIIPLGALGESYVKMDMDKVVEIYKKQKPGSFQSAKAAAAFAALLIKNDALSVKIDKYAEDQIIKNTDATNAEQAQEVANSEVMSILKEEIIVASVRDTTVPEVPAGKKVEAPKKVETPSFKLDGSFEVINANTPFEFEFKINKADVIAELDADPSMGNEENIPELAFKLMSAKKIDVEISDELIDKASETIPIDQVLPFFGKLALTKAVAQIKEERKLEEVAETLPLTEKEKLIAERDYQIQMLNDMDASPEANTGFTSQAEVNAEIKKITAEYNKKINALKPKKKEASQVGKVVSGEVAQTAAAKSLGKHVRPEYAEYGVERAFPGTDMMISTYQDNKDNIPVEEYTEVMAMLISAQTGKPVPEEEAFDPELQAQKEALAKRYKKPQRRRDRDTDDLLREKTKKSLEPFKAENWDKVADWMKKNFPNIPLYRVQNVIQSTNGKQAYGLYRQGAAYVYKNAEAGTAYHEVFHAVWDMFVSPKEKKAIKQEFRNRKGSYVDRFTQEEIKFAEATDAQLNEELAEEFREKVLYNKEPRRKPKSLIRSLFNDMISFFNTFFFGKDSLTNTQKLFNKMGNGDYAAFIPHENTLEQTGETIRDIENIEINSQDQLRVKLDGIPAKQEHEIYQHMTHKIVNTLINSDEGLFGINQKLKIGDYYPGLLEELVGEDGIISLEQSEYIHIMGEDPSQTDALEKKIADLDGLKQSIIASWDIEGGIKDRHMASLNPYNITFDEKENEILEDENQKAQDAMDSNKIDSYKKANAAVKLLFATLPDIAVDEETQKPYTVPSSIGGVTFEQADKVYITLLNAVHNSTNVDTMLAKLRELGLAPDGYHYANLYRKLTKTSVNAPMSDSIFDNKELNRNNLRLLTGFWKAMKKSNPAVPIVYVFEDGTVEVADTSTSSAARELRQEYGKNILAFFREDTEENNVWFKKLPNGLYAPTAGLKNKKFDVKDIGPFVKFLNLFEIDIKESDLRKLKRTDNEAYVTFLDATKGLLESIQSMDNFYQFTLKDLDASKRLFQISNVVAKIKTPIFETTHYGIDGERSQNFIGTNSTTDLYDNLTAVENKNELKDTPFKHLLTDVFTKGSVIMSRMFNKKNGKRTSGTQDIMAPVYIGGTINEITDKKIASSNLKYGDRLAQEINLNLSGIYNNLVPGDSELEWGIRMHPKNAPFMNMEGVNDKDYLKTFRGYFIDEVNLARDSRIVPGKRNAKDLRFFKDILDSSDPSLHKDIMEEPVTVSPEELYEKYGPRINKAVEAFIMEDTRDTKQLIWDYKLVKPSMQETGKFETTLAFDNQLLSPENVAAEAKKLSVNYMIANIEQHKMLYSDPYQYSDELKRIKNFNSPRQAILYGSPEASASLHEAYNEGFEEGSLGYSDMKKESFSTITVEDVFSSMLEEGYENINQGEGWEETDGAGMISFQAHRIFKIRASEWTPANEAQYRWDIEYQQRLEDIKNAPDSEKLTMHKEFEAFRDARKKHVKSTYTPSKPIVSGNKGNDRNFNDLILDKYALFPLSFRIFHEMDPNSNILKFSEKMREEKIDYAVYASGRKVGAEETYPLYKDGKLNTEPFQTTEEKEEIEKKNPEDRSPRRVTEVPFSIMSLQTEVPSKEDNRVTQGSQITKLATLDYNDGGVPIDYLEGRKEDHSEVYDEWEALSEEKKKEASPLYKEMQHNKALLEEKIRVGYETVLEKLGIDAGENSFTIVDKQKLLETLRTEIAKQDMNNNLIEAFEGVQNGDVLLEATPVYQQIRSTLYSIANNNVIKPKITGGMKVQMPSTLFESGNRIVRGTSKKGNQYLHSDILKFYERETRAEDGTLIKAKTAEIMVGRWFHSNKSDEELLDYLNNTPEGQRILNGVAFRTPTQKQNSIEAIRIKKFLPTEYGDSVVIPSAMTRKTGSDFDIDKLSIYLKNTYNNKNGFPMLVPYFGMDERKAKAAIEKLIDEVPEEFNTLSEIGGSIFDQIQAALSDTSENIVNRLYAKGIENEYIESLERLIMNPLNFNDLVKPNSADELKELTEHINVKLGRDTNIDFTSPGFMLSRKNMSGLRDAFVGGKKAIGVAAVGQTNHANNQAANVFVDVSNSSNENIDEDDRYFLNGMEYAEDKKKPELRFQEYNKIIKDGMDMPSLSRVKNAAGKTISDIIGMFIDGYVDISKGPWIMQMGATNLTAGTWLFLAKIGIPMNTVAYFMNQPIIADLVRETEITGSTFLLNKKTADMLLNKYRTKANVAVTVVPSEKELNATMGMDIADMSDSQKKQQQLILKEFYKATVMATHLFKVTQGTNFDTATFNDPFLVFKKMEQLKIARNTIISSPDKILDASFLGTLNDTLRKVRDAFSEILLSDKNDTDNYTDTPRSVLERVLLPYVELSDRNFVGLSQRVVSDFFDWAMQTDTFTGSSINKVIAKTLLGTETEDSAAKQIIDFKDSIFGKVSENLPPDTDHPLFGNIALEAMTFIKGEREGVPDNIAIKGKNNKTYDQNQIINSFVEVKEYLQSNPEQEYAGIYRQMVRLSILQSGLTSSPIAFSKLLPYEEFRDVYNSTLERLEGSPDISNFADMKVFERNNWSRKDWVPVHKTVTLETSEGVATPTTDNVDSRLKDAEKNKRLPKTIFISEGNNNANDVIEFRWSEFITSKERLKRAREGNTSHLHRTLMRKVYQVDEFGNREPLIQTKVKGKNAYRGYVYVAINAWGDSFRAKEFYNYSPVIVDGQFTGEMTVPTSVLNNGFDPVVEFTYEGQRLLSGEVSDEYIAGILNQGIRVTDTDVVDDSQKENVSLEKEKIKSPPVLEKRAAKVSSRILKADIEFAKDQVIDHDVLAWNNDVLSPRIDLGISRAEIKAGEKAIRAGKMKSVTAMRVILALKQAKANGFYDFMEGAGGNINKMSVPIIDTTGKKKGDPNQIDLFDQEFNQEDNEDTCVPF